MKSSAKHALKVVAHLRDRSLIKGYTDALPVRDLHSLIEQVSVVLPPEISVRPSGSTDVVSLPTDGLKALFFVKSFEGRRDYKEVKFFDTHPRMDGLWVRMRFYDGEATEGLIRNSLDFLITPGFFLKPPDPGSNNEIVYVVKSSLIEFKTLGVRTNY